jgi:murein L,D-transpeptidase YcbB/YkuD
MGVSIHRAFARPVFLLGFLLVPAFLTPAADGLHETAFPAIAQTGPSFSPQDVQSRLATIGVPDYAAEDTRGRELWKAVHRFYQARGYSPAWVAGGRLTRQAEGLLRAALQSDGDGMDAAPYAQLASQARGIRRASAADWADPALDLDLRTTYTLLRYADEMTNGRFDPRGMSALWSLQPAGTDVVPLLARASQTGLTDELQATLSPQHPQYQALRRELERYRELARRGGWEELEPGTALKPGQRGPRVASLGARLVAGGDLEDPAADVPDLPRESGMPAVTPGPAYDAAMAAAVKQFKARHGLAPDAVVDKATVDALNVPVGERIRQIELNLERWRWLPRPLGERYVLVNIPTFELNGYEAGRRTIHMRVVTGTAGETPTPVFTERMTHLVFSPYWNVPPGIAQEEVAPAAWHNRTYLARNNMEVLRGDRVVDPGSVDLGDPRLQFRQRPGPGNSLGRVKFMLPNRYNVYLHDTPAKSLFAKARRDYSHGCVRVHEPFELARWVLRGTDWTADRIRAAMNAGEEKHVRLAEPLPVYVSYFTVWVDDEGRAQFRPDVYRHDAAHEPLLPAAPPLDEAPSLKVAGTVVAAVPAVF